MKKSTIILGVLAGLFLLSVITLSMILYQSAAASNQATDQYNEQLTALE